MQEQFVTWDIALKLKELGFNEECFGLFTRNKEFLVKDFITNEEAKEYYGGIATPLWQQAIDWFREKHNKIITVYSNASGYLWETHDAIGGTQREWSDYSGPNDSGCWDTYEEAREQAILKALELITK